MFSWRSKKNVNFFFFLKKNATVITLNIGTDRPEQTV